MITVTDKVFHIQTKATSYIFRILEEGYLENLHYGNKIRVTDDYSPLYEKHSTGYGMEVSYGQDKTLTLDNICLEYSSSGVGDYRHEPMELKMPEGSYSNDFIYKGYELYEGIYKESEKTHMPYAMEGEDQVKGEIKEEKEKHKRNKEYIDASVETLEITLVDSLYHIELVLIYTCFYSSNIITRRVKLSNNTKESIVINKIMSMQLDLPDSNYTVNTFDGLWARERHRNETKLHSGIYVNDSTTGASSNRHNPLIILAGEDATEHTGSCYGMNLIYSGNHYEAIEVSGYHKTRLMTGISPYHFQWELKEGDRFYSPEAVLTYSFKGKNGVSHNFHHFIQEHIVRGEWAKKERPILINNWEATYFKFNESKLLKIAKSAKELGIELFVLDDGWFGQREDDTTSLGDWVVNEKKLGGSLNNLVNKINKIGLSFGLWFEPEMISEMSDLYKIHPEYAIKVPNRTPRLGRNQLVLDFTKKEVRDYVIDAISSVLSSANIEYVKWDMNRHISDGYSGELKERQGEFYHRYILGLYEVLEVITKRFPHILFESCSSGGNRFDLGMLVYMPQVWTSDNTDANERVTIQEGTTYGYPLSTMTAHVSASPNHQTLRSTSLETRFQVACFGVLGYELDVTKLSMAEKKIVKEQIEFYKKHRKLFQYGQFDRVKEIRKDRNTAIYQVVDEEKSEAISLLYKRLATPNSGIDRLRVLHLTTDQQYEISVRKQKISIKQFGSLVNQVTPIKIKEEGILQATIDQIYNLESEDERYQLFGDMLAEPGIKIKQEFTGVGYNEDTRVMGDFSSRLYIVKKR